MEHRNRFQEIDSSNLCSLAGWHDKPILSRFLAPLDCSEIPAQATQTGGIDSLEWIPGLLKRLKIPSLKQTKLLGLHKRVNAFVKADRYVGFYELFETRDLAGRCPLVAPPVRLCRLSCTYGDPGGPAGDNCTNHRGHLLE